MTGWITLLLSNLFFAALLTAGGFWLARQPPPRGLMLGYRTPRSKLSDETWDYANRAWGRLMRLLGPIWAAVVVVAMLVALGRSDAFVAVYGCGLLFGAALVALLSMVPVERALRREFDADGRPLTRTAV